MQSSRSSATLAAQRTNIIVKKLLFFFFFVQTSFLQTFYHGRKTWNSFLEDLFGANHYHRSVIPTEPPNRDHSKKPKPNNRNVIFFGKITVDNKSIFLTEPKFWVHYIALPCFVTLYWCCYNFHTPRISISAPDKLILRFDDTIVMCNSIVVIHKWSRLRNVYDNTFLWNLQSTLKLTNKYVKF